MDFLIGPYTSLLAFFFMLGLLFAGLLLARGINYQHPPSYWLSLFLLLCSGYITPFMLGYDGWYGKDGYADFLFFMPCQQLFFLGPVIYCYTRSLLEDDFRLKGKEWLHFLPGGLYLLFTAVVFVVDFLILDEYYFYDDGKDMDLDNWYQYSGLISVAIYTYLSLRRYNEYRKRIFEELSYADTVVYGWMRQFLVALLAILVLRIVFMILLPNFGQFGNWFWYYFGFSLLFTFIGIAGYTNVVKSMAPLRWLREKQPIVEELQAPKPSPTTTVMELDLEKWKTRVEALFLEDKLYENPTLTLRDMADRLGVTTKQVSGIINQGFGMNFNDFVNHHRVTAVLERFERGDHEKFTILSIALACGFNSKTTFNRAFKRQMARTPVQYLSEKEQKTA
jgi:AraC-like DNA-binding protein